MEFVWKTFAGPVLRYTLTFSALLQWWFANFQDFRPDFTRFLSIDWETISAVIRSTYGLDLVVLVEDWALGNGIKRFGSIPFESYAAE